MSSKSIPDRLPPSDPHSLSLSDVRDLILTDEAVPEHRRKAMASAIATVARLLRRPAESLPASPILLRPLLAPVTPAMGRLTAGSWSNARSLLAGALARVIPGFLPQRFDLEPSDAWSGCLDRVRPNHNTFFLLGRFARWATRQGVEPSEVSDAIVARYERDLVERSLTGEPHRITRKTVAAWNAMVSRPDWPGAPLTLQSRRVRHSLDWSAYPPSLLDEVERWLDHLGRDPLADRDFRALRPASIRSRQKYLALYLGALAEAGEDPAGMTPASRR